MSPSRPGRLRGVNPSEPKDNRLRSLTGLCGLSSREVADFLELTPGTVEQKMLGKRGIMEGEEAKLAGLWKRILKGNVDSTDPAGAVRRHVAIISANAIACGADPGQIEQDWWSMIAEEDG